MSKSDYVYIDYPPRILMRVQQTSLNQTSSRGQLCPKLKLKGTLKENCFNLPLPVPDTPLLSPQRTQLESQQLPLPSPSLLPPLKRDAQILVSPQKHRSLYSVPDLQELAETVTPNIHHKWHHVGIQMGLQTATLSAIENRHPTDIQRRLNEVFHEWIARSEQSPTWMTLIEILRLNSIGEQKFASELEKSFD